MLTNGGVGFPRRYGGISPPVELVANNRPVADVFAFGQLFALKGPGELNCKVLLVNTHPFIFIGRFVMAGVELLMRMHIESLLNTTPLIFTGGLACPCAILLISMAILASSISEEPFALLEATTWPPF